MTRATAVFRRVAGGMWPETRLLRGSGTYYAAHDPTGSASLKSVISGTTVWTASGRRFVLTDRMHVVLNPGEYTVEIDSPRVETNTLCIFFEPGLLDDVHRTLTTNALDAGDAPPLQWRETIEPWDARVWPLLSALDENAPSAELITRIAETLVAQRTEIPALPVVRASTREEIYRRVSRGRDFLLSSLSERVAMKDAARAAAMSPYHFHRAFRDAFGEPPHRYLASRRLERAAHLLRTTSRTVTEICRDSGFESVPSFTNAFRRRYGVAPGNYRAAGSGVRPHRDGV